MINAEGFHSMPEGVYHSDPVETPSLNSSTAKRILSHSPKHAAAFHPRLGGGSQEHKDEFDFGKAVHALLLEQRSNVAVLDFDSYRSKEARAFRDRERAFGRIPLLAKKWAAVQRTVIGIKTALAAREDAADYAIDENTAVEQTLVWRDGDAWCRARLDALRPGLVWDLKTAQSANPESFARSIFSFGYDIQEAFYRRGLRRITGKEFEFRFVVVESAWPHDVSVVELSPEVKHVADQRVERAIQRWSQCMKANRWPGYSSEISRVEAPSWWLAREIDHQVQEAS